LVFEGRLDEPIHPPVEWLVVLGHRAGHRSNLDGRLPLSATAVGGQVLMAGLEVVSGATVEIVEEADSELQRSPPMWRLRRLNDEFVYVLVYLFEVKADDTEVTGVVELEKIEAKRHPIEGLGGSDREGLAHQAVVDLAGVFETNTIDLEGSHALCAGAVVKCGPAVFVGTEFPELVDLQTCGFLAYRNRILYPIEADK